MPRTTPIATLQATQGMGSAPDEQRRQRQRKGNATNSTHPQLRQTEHRRNQNHRSKNSERPKSCGQTSLRIRRRHHRRRRHPGLPARPRPALHRIHLPPDHRRPRHQTNQNPSIQHSRRDADIQERIRRQRRNDVDPQHSHRRRTGPRIQTRISEHHTDGQTHQNRAGCKRQHVVRILRRFSDRELRHRLGRDDDDDAVRREGGSAGRSPGGSQSSGAGVVGGRTPPPMEDHAITRRTNLIREYQDQRMPVHQAPRTLGRWGHRPRGGH